MGEVLSDGLIEMFNTMSPASQQGLLGTRLDQALGGVLPTGSIGTDELANKAITGPKMGSGIGYVVAAEDAHTIADDENLQGLTSSYTLANSLKALMVLHMEDYGAGAEEHITLDGAAVTLDAIADASTLATLITLVTGLITAYVAHDDDVDEAVPVVHQAQSTLNNLASAAAPTTLDECVTRLNDIKAKHNLHDANATSHSSGSTHQEAEADAAQGVGARIVIAAAASGDIAVMAVLNGGTGTVTGVSAAAGAGYVDFTFSADPQDDAIISYTVTRIPA